MQEFDVLSDNDLAVIERECDSLPRGEPLRQFLTIDELKTRNLRAYNAFMDFTEAQTMFWQLSIGPDGDLWAVDYQMDARIQWVAEIGMWQ